MQLYLTVRGEADQMERYKNDLQAQYLPYEYEPGKVGKLQLGVRKIEIWELAFPKDQLNTVLGMIVPFDTRLARYINFLRKILGLKNLGKRKVKQLFLPRGDVCVMPIGLKEDKMVPQQRRKVDWNREII